MTQEEKAKAYDKALEIARKINSGEGVAVPSDWTICETIFPELKENKIAYGYFPNEFSSYEDYIKYLKEKGFAFEVPERKYKKEQQ